MFRRTVLGASAFSIVLAAFACTTEQLGTGPGGSGADGLGDASVKDGATAAASSDGSASSADGTIGPPGSFTAREDRDGGAVIRMGDKATSKVWCWAYQSDAGDGRRVIRMLAKNAEWEASLSFALDVEFKAPATLSYRTYPSTASATFKGRGDTYDGYESEFAINIASYDSRRIAGTFGEGTFVTRSGVVRHLYIADGSFDLPIGAPPP